MTALRARSGVAAVALAATPFAVEAARATGSPWLIGLLAAIQAATAALLLGRAGRAPAVAGAALSLGLATAFAIGLPAGAVSLVVSGTWHACAYGALLAWFAASLRPGREPVVTGLARRMRRSMPDAVARYTRRVTLAWCVFFALELLASAGLLLAAPVAVWSAFVNLFNLPLIAAMMLGEFAVRAVLFRREQRTGLAATLGGLRRFGRTDRAA